MPKRNKKRLPTFLKIEFEMSRSVSSSSLFFGSTYESGLATQSVIHTSYQSCGRQGKKYPSHPNPAHWSRILYIRNTHNKGTTNKQTSKQDGSPLSPNIVLVFLDVLAALSPSPQTTALAIGDGLGPGSGTGSPPERPRKETRDAPRH